MAYSALTIFDLDHTLVSINTSFHLSRRLSRKKNAYISPYTLCIWYFFLYKYCGLSLIDLHKKAFQSLFYGRSKKEIEEIGKEFANKDLEQFLYQPALEKLRHAKAQNHYIVLLSSSPALLVKPIAGKLGVDEFFATQYDINDKDCLVSINQIVEGGFKAKIAAEMLQKLGLKQTNLFAYSDSIADLPLLQFAGKAIGVKPEKQLKRICQKNGWEII